MTAIKPGDEVLVYDGWHARQDRTAIPGEVVKVGRTLVRIRYRGREEAFRIDTGIINDSNGGAEFETPEQAEARARKDAALAVLREAGFEVRMGRKPSGGLIEALAAVVETFGQDG
jgi:hypothetical protein